MENAVDALKIAFAVMVFTMALTLAISTFSQARETSEALLYMNDKTNYYVYDEIEEGVTETVGTTATTYTTYTSVSSGITYTDKRIVGIDAIIPTLYRYYKENYTVIFENTDGSKLPIYYLDSTNKWDKDNTGSEDDAINYFDLNSEITANCPWVGTVNDIKKNLDLFLDGTSKYNSSQLDKISFGNTARCVKYEYGTGNEGFIKAYENATFLEQLGEYSTDRNYGIQTDTEGIKWVVIGDEKYRFNSETGMVNATEGSKDEVFNKKISILLEEKHLDLDIGNNATTQWSEETDWEVIELAKPTIKRVIKYTLIENNP